VRVFLIYIADEIEPGANNITLFDLIKKIYNRLINSDIQVNDSNIDFLISLIKKVRELKQSLRRENIILNLNDSLQSSGMRL